MTLDRHSLPWVWYSVRNAVRDYIRHRRVNPTPRWWPGDRHPHLRCLKWAWSMFKQQFPLIWQRCVRCNMPHNHRERPHCEACRHHIGPCDSCGAEAAVKWGAWDGMLCKDCADEHCGACGERKGSADVVHARKDHDGKDVMTCSQCAELLDADHCIFCGDPLDGPGLFGCSWFHTDKTPYLYRFVITKEGLEMKC